MLSANWDSFCLPRVNPDPPTRKKEPLPASDPLLAHTLCNCQVHAYYYLSKLCPRALDYKVLNGIPQTLNVYDRFEFSQLMLHAGENQKVKVEGIFLKKERKV